jgi:Protein of unknown function (DUF1161)
MKLWTVGAALLFVGAQSFSQTSQTAPAARKSCDDLKAEIIKKLEAKSVTSYSLDVVDRGKEAADNKVVGSCDGGAKSIVYSRPVPSQSKESEEKKPQ